MREIPFARPTIGEAEFEAARRVLSGGWLTTGNEADNFEEEFARDSGNRYARAVSSATAGLHLALEAMGVGRGDRVVISPYTFVASANAIHYLGATPLFVDIDIDTGNIDPARLEEALENAEREKRPVKAIMAIHIGGYPCQMEQIMRLARRFGCGVVEDAAHCQPGLGDGSVSGHRGDCAVYSFYATKPIATGEGGMVTTDNDAIAHSIERNRLHGIDRDVWRRYCDAKYNWKYDITSCGYKYNMSDLMAAIGRTQLRRGVEMAKRRAEIAARYFQLFNGCAALTLPPKGDAISWHLYTVRLRLDLLTIGRDEVADRMRQQKIGISVHYIPLHYFSYFRDRYRIDRSEFPVANRRYNSVLSLPIYPLLRDEEIEYICATLRDIIQKHLK